MNIGQTTSGSIYIAKNIAISPNFLGWKFCGKAQIPQSFGQICPKLCENCAFSQNFHSRKLGEITVFCTVSGLTIFIS